MDMQELKNMWQAYDNKLERSLQLNRRCVEIIQSQRVRSKLRLLFISRIIEVALHIIVIWWLARFLFAHFFEAQFAISAAALLFFFIVAFIYCIRQIILINEIDYSKSITGIQKKLTLLQSHIVDYVRLTFLGLPTYLAYPIIAFKALANFDIVSTLNHNWWIGQIIFSIIIIPVCVWLYRKVSYKNLNKKWVRFIIEKSTGNSLTKAMKFIKEIDDFTVEAA